MSAWSALDRGTRVLILLLVGVLAAGIGYLGWQMSRSDPVAVSADPQPAVTVAETAATETATAAATPEPAPEPVPEAAGSPPVIDTWRVTAEGEAVVSGSADPGAKIEVMVDGSVVAGGEVAATGEFALLFTLAPNPKPSLMWLSMTPSGKPAIASAEMVALGPIEGPKLAAAEAPAAADETPEAPEVVAAAEEPTAPPALLLSQDGAVVLQEPAPEAPATRANVMIDTISYTPEGEVQIGGRGLPGAALRLYLDNAEKLTLQVPETGLWVTTLPDTAPGIYSLRVDQLDAEGKVTSRFETPFKRETLEALAAVAGTAAAPEPSAPEPSTEEVAALAEAPVAATAPDVSAVPEPPVSEEVAADEPGSTEAVPTPEATTEVAEAPEPAEVPVEPQADSETVASAAAPVTITVQPGFTLWGIAQEAMGDGVMYVQVFEANRDKIKDPDLIYPGQVFSMPGTASP
ncbi:LysM peptidoglycan-binding domain-containing protein [Tabrizicola sp.]|uniref:LysM peptidoglycan-binding domain-containing protein n=1 Tax=Tabrizicola sp. TaxID=2005166 RepID=UPI003F3D52B2